MSNFAKRMKNLASGFEDALKNAGRGRGGLPVGRYQVKVIGTDVSPIKNGKSAGKIGVMFTFQVVEGKKQGGKQTKFTNLEQLGKKGEPVGLSIVLGDLKTMGIPVKKSELAGLDSKIAEAEGRIVEIQVVENAQGYKNVYVNKLIDVGDEDIDDEELEDEEDEEDEEEEVEEEEEEEPEPPKKRGPGRPKGSKNKPKKKTKKSSDDDEDVEDLFD